MQRNKTRLEKKKVNEQLKSTLERFALNININTETAEIRKLVLCKIDQARELLFKLHNWYKNMEILKRVSSQI